MIKTKFDSLDEAVKSWSRCRALTFLSINKNFKDSGSSLVKLRNLRELHLQGDPSIYNNYEFSLPSQIGELKKLRKLVLLNLPIESFPGWVFKLNKLEYLMIRGTDVKDIPNEISALSQLTTLRVENCPLTELPRKMTQLRRLKNLGLSDTKLTAIDRNILPQGLRRINLVGTELSVQSNKLKDLNLKHGHVD